MKKSGLGFTLIEILVVITGVGLLAATAIVANRNLLHYAKIARTQKIQTEWNAALRLYITEHEYMLGEQPLCLAGMDCAADKEIVVGMLAGGIPDNPLVSTDVPPALAVVNVLGGSCEESLEPAAAAGHGWVWFTFKQIILATTADCDSANPAEWGLSLCPPEGCLPGSGLITTGGGGGNQEE